MQISTLSLLPQVAVFDRFKGELHIHTCGTKELGVTESIPFSKVTSCHPALPGSFLVLTVPNYYQKEGSRIYLCMSGTFPPTKTLIIKSEDLGTRILYVFELGNGRFFLTGPKIGTLWVSYLLVILPSGNYNLTDLKLNLKDYWKILRVQIWHNFLLVSGMSEGRQRKYSMRWFRNEEGKYTEFAGTCLSSFAVWEDYLAVLPEEDEVQLWYLKEGIPSFLNRITTEQSVISFKEGLIKVSGERFDLSYWTIEGKRVDLNPDGENTKGFYFCHDLDNNNDQLLLSKGDEQDPRPYRNVKVLASINLRPTLPFQEGSISRPSEKAFYLLLPSPKVSYWLQEQLRILLPLPTCLSDSVLSFFSPGTNLILCEDSNLHRDPTRLRKLTEVEHLSYQVSW